MKPLPYKPKKTSEEEILYLNTLYEQIVRIRKFHTQHWILKDIKQEFKVTCLNKWDPHSVNISDIAKVGKNYITLAESDKGPQIIEHNNSIAVQFIIDERYPETIKLLCNFITKMSEEIKVFCLIL